MCCIKSVSCFLHSKEAYSLNKQQKINLKNAKDLFKEVLLSKLRFF